MNQKTQLTVMLPGDEFIVQVRARDDGRLEARPHGTGIVVVAETEAQLAVEIQASLHEQFAWLLRRKDRISERAKGQLQMIASLLNETSE